MRRSGACVRRASIGVIGAGWWAQGWHLPQLHAHKNGGKRGGETSRTGARTHSHAHAYAHTCARTHTRTRACTRARAHSHAHAHAYAHKCTRTHTHSATIRAIVDAQEAPSSPLADPPLEPLSMYVYSLCTHISSTPHTHPQHNATPFHTRTRTSRLAERYQTSVFNTVDELFQVTASKSRVLFRLAFLCGGLQVSLLANPRNDTCDRRDATHASFSWKPSPNPNPNPDPNPQP